MSHVPNAALGATGYAELPAGQGQGLPKISKPFTKRELEAMVAPAAAVSTASD
jgi:hypothetical protein